MLKKLLLPLLLAVLAAGCATTTVRAPVAPVVTPAFAEAQQLARELVTLDPSQRKASAARIDNLLSGIDDASLIREASALPLGDPLYNFAGRTLLDRGLALPRPLDRNAAPAHVLPRPPADADGYRPPLKLAVLLPLSGNLATAATPVRDGFLSGYYAEQRRRPEVVFFDTAIGVSAAYDQAAAAGADFVVGPLGREQVDLLFGKTALAVPVLALNRGNVAPPPGSAGFALAPEDDGIAAAEYAIARGARRALILANTDDSMRRASAAFRAQLSRRGGTIVAELGVGADPGDMGTALATAVHSDGGVDAVFLALRPLDARALAPQLSVAGLSGKPWIATSQLATASTADTAGHALDSLVFPSDAWSVGYVPGLPSAASAATLLQSARGPAQRLFAFGFDAWRIAAYLDYLAGDANASIAGATGTLRLDDSGNVVRNPGWARWNGDLVMLLPDGGR
ncbi:MAG: penicillin-binding protein activator [Luteimonas sp.]